jgi:hypothetical protein
MPSLKERFEQFMSCLQWAENIDDLMRNSTLPGRLRADYLAFRRDVIIEQKSFEADLDTKVEPLIIQFFRDRGIASPSKISFASFVDVLAQHSDAHDLIKTLRRLVTRRVDDVLADADKQTRDTRKTFLIPNAVGIVVILNDSVQLIEPDFVAVQAFETLRKRTATGELRYPHNQVVISISEAHRIPSSEAESIPTETVFSESGNTLQIANQYSALLLELWARFNGAGVKSSAIIRDVVTRDAPKLFRTEAN